MASKCIQIRVETKQRLDNLKLVNMESYDSVIQRLLEKCSEFMVMNKDVQ